MSVVRIIGVVAGLLLLVVCGGVALIAFIANPSMSDEGQRGGTIFLVAVALLGFFIVRRSSPTFFSRAGASFIRVGASPAGFVRSMLRPGSLRRPLGLATWTLVVGAVLLAVAPRGGVRGLIALGAVLIYFVASMVSLVAFPGWWRRALLTLLLGPVVMFGVGLTAEAFEKNAVGEAGLALVGVLMWSWAIIPVTGLVRLLFVRPSPSPSDGTQPS
jgi:hypothetical protein